MSPKTLVVRRGLGLAYYFYLSVFARENNLNLLVDRRIGERRNASKSSAGGRRGREPKGESVVSHADVHRLCVIESRPRGPAPFGPGGPRGPPVHWGHPCQLL